MQALTFTIYGASQAAIHAMAVSVATSYFGDTNYTLEVGSPSLQSAPDASPLSFAAAVVATETA